MGVSFPAYNGICSISASARSCFALGQVRTSKVGTSGAAFGLRQVLRTIVASSAISVAKLRAGVPSFSVWRAALFSAALERLAGATTQRRANGLDLRRRQARQI